MAKIIWKGVAKKNDPIYGGGFIISYPKSFKLPRNVPNSQLYKQAGNTVTVDVIKVLAKSILKTFV